jgi:hypothetical protein
MKAMQQPSARYRMEDRFPSLHFVIRSRRNWIVVALLAIWLGLWTVGEVFVGRAIIRTVGSALSAGAAPDLAGGTLFVLIWFTLWTLGGVLALSSLLWQVAGREIVDIEGEMLSIRRAIFGAGRPQEYTAAYVDNLRVVPHGQAPYRRSGFSAGRLAFDYQHKTVYFGEGLDGPSARQMVNTIAERFPDLAKGVE